MSKIVLSDAVRDVLREILSLHSSENLKEIGSSDGYVLIKPKAIAAFVRKARKDPGTLQRFEYLLNEILSGNSKIVV